VIYTYKGGMKAVGVDGARAGGIYISGGSPRSSSSASRAGRMVDDLESARRAARRRCSTSRSRCRTRTRLGGTHRRCVPRHGVARHRPAHRAAADVVASLKDAQRAIIGSGFVVFVQFFLFLTIGSGCGCSTAADLPATDQIFPRSSSSTCRTGSSA
jgi:hypothetical protein